MLLFVLIVLYFIQWYACEEFLVLSDSHDIYEEFREKKLHIELTRQETNAVIVPKIVFQIPIKISVKN